MQVLRTFATPRSAALVARYASAEVGQNRQSRMHRTVWCHRSVWQGGRVVDLKVAQLRERCAALGLPTAGKKAGLSSL